MDTLYDHRKFPEEMHEQNPHPSQKKNKGIIFLLVLIGILVILALLFFVMKKTHKVINKESPSEEPTQISVEERDQNLKELDALVPEQSQAERDKELQFFFN